MSVHNTATFSFNHTRALRFPLPVIFQTDPAGTYSAWKANAIGGNNSKNMREFLEKNWANDMDEGAAKKLCMKVGFHVATAAASVGTVAGAIAVVATCCYISVDAVDVGRC